MIYISLKKKLDGAEGALPLAVEMTIEKGQFVTIYGASGAGKTSILRMLAGLMQADRGQITVHQNTWLDTERGIRLKPQQRSIGFVFQDYALFPNMTVKENLLYALDQGQNKSIVSDLIQLIELEDLQLRKPTTLSGGQQQRVALARALIRKPQILLLDEPLSALDIKMRRKLQDYLLQVHQQYQLTTILISHDIGEVIKLSDQVFVLEKGKISKHGIPTEVFTSHSMSGSFQFTGEVLKIKKEEVVYILTILIGTNIVKVVAEEKEVENLMVGDKVVVGSKAFNPLVWKIFE